MLIFLFITAQTLTDTLGQMKLETNMENSVDTPNKDVLLSLVESLKIRRQFLYNTKQPKEIETKVSYHKS